jgi:hypothetical protein
VADIEKLLALDVQEDAIALETAEIVAVSHDLPWILNPEFLEGLVELAGRADQGAAIGGL